MTLKLARALPGVPGRNFVLPIDRMHYEAAPPYLVDMPALSRRMEMDLARRMVVYGHKLLGCASALKPARYTKNMLYYVFWISARCLISGSWWAKRLMAAGAH